MLEQIKYINNFGDVFEFGKEYVFANSNDLRDYAWQYDTGRNKAENFRRKVTKKKLPVVIKASSEEQCSKIKNDMLNIFDKDVIAEKPGTLWIDDYYMQCYIVESSKSKYLDNRDYTKISLVVVSDTGTWCKDVMKSFLYSESLYDASGHGYNYGYDYDYAIAGVNSGILDNPHFASCDFEIKISGYAYHPEILISGHRYKLNYEILEDQYVVINSKDRTIKLVRVDGTVENLFRLRDKESNIFEKIPAGTSEVYWTGNYNFDVTLYIERGEPEWT